MNITERRREEIAELMDWTERIKFSSRLKFVVNFCEN
jgi:hypothetical protein